MRLSRLTFIRQIYRRLFDRGRTYAAFQKEFVFPLVKSLKSTQLILDPMSGYGSLMNFCSELGISSHLVELNPPSHFWQVLTNPNNAKFFLLYLNEIKKIKFKTKLPKASITDEWYSNESKVILEEIFFKFFNIGKSLAFKDKDNTSLVLAILLPFVGRFASCVQGNIVIDIRPGGICIFENWQKDFKTYVKMLESKIKELSYIKAKKHEIVLDDCRTCFPKKKFSAMITSPPYPNYKDYTKMFAPENEFLNYLSKQTNLYIPTEKLIGTIIVKNRKHESQNNLMSKSAIEFLNLLKELKGNRKQIRDMSNYYYPYFLNYFIDLEQAYTNVSGWLSDNFCGYIIAVNNTSKNKIVPLSDIIIDVWKKLGFKAAVLNDYQREVSHVGTINPIVKGLKARHYENTIKVWR